MELYLGTVNPWIMTEASSKLSNGSFIVHQQCPNSKLKSVCLYLIFWIWKRIEFMWWEQGGVGHNSHASWRAINSKPHYSPFLHFCSFIPSHFTSFSLSFPLFFPLSLSSFSIPHFLSLFHSFFLPICLSSSFFFSLLFYSL